MAPAPRGGQRRQPRLGMAPLGRTLSPHTPNSWQTRQSRPLATPAPPVSGGGNADLAGSSAGSTPLWPPRSGPAEPRRRRQGQHHPQVAPDHGRPQVALTSATTHRWPLTTAARLRRASPECGQDREQAGVRRREGWPSPSHAFLWVRCTGHLGGRRGAGQTTGQRWTRPSPGPAAITPLRGARCVAVQKRSLDPTWGVGVPRASGNGPPLPAEGGFLTGAGAGASFCVNGAV